MRSLRARLNVAFVVPTAAIVIVLVAVGHVAARQGLEEELEKRLQAVAQVIAVDMSEDIDAVQLSRLDESMHRVRTRFEGQLRDARDSTEVGRIFIFDEDARTLVDTDETVAFGSTQYRARSDRSEVRRTFEQGVATSGPLFQTDQGDYYKVAYAPITYEGETVAVVGVVASATYFDLLTWFTTVLTLLGALGVAVVIGLGFLIARQLVRPVDTLVAGARRLAEGDLETPVVSRARREWSSVEEFEILMESFEEMRKAIVERDEQMQMMLGGIAHEVRNPLGGIELFCGLLKEDLQELRLQGEQGRSPPVEKLERIEREVAYLEDLVEHFLDYAGSGELDRRRMDAADFVDEVVELVEGDAKKAKCRLQVEIEEGMQLTADPGRLRRALLNVIRNACQACDIEEAVVTVRGRCEGATSQLEIRDSGCGIDDERLDKLCKPFYTTREKGSGLGLALTKKVIEDHGGELFIDSRVGEGTTVRFVLPFDEAVDKRVGAGRQQEIPEGWLG